MAIETLVLDGFGGYSSVAVMEDNRRWDDVGGGLALYPTSGRGGGRCLGDGVGTIQYEASQTLPKTVRTVVLGFAFLFDVIPANLSTSPLFFSSGSYLNDTYQISVCLGTDGKLAVYRGSHTGTVLATGTTVLQVSTWYYLEFRAYIDNTLGEYELKIDSVTEVSGTGVDTQASAENHVSRAALGIPDYTSNQGTKFVLMDDLYIRGDPSANTAGGFWGDVRIEEKFPNANGTNRDWTLSTGTDDFAVLDEMPATHTDYAYSSTAADQITCGMEDLSGSDTIKGVALLGRTAIGSSGSRELKPVCKSGATTDVGAAARVLQYAYMKPAIYELDPNTAAAWTETNINAAEFGFEVV